jgi:survival of motor neuron-related-splicing factor 30
LGLQSGPSNAELLELKNELDQVIALSESAIADLAPPSAAPKAQPKAAAAATSAPEKWKRENHPKFRDAVATPAVEEESRDEKPNFKVNDTVLAKWHSGDKGFYPARIKSITGSSVDPVYIVKFKNYDTVETLRGRDVKAVSTAAKRKADGTPVAAFGSGAGERRESAGGVISAEADIDKEAQMKREKEASKVGDGPVRPERAPKKIKANKELEKGKSKWQDWAAKGMGGKKGPAMGKKESMFRTPEGVHGRGMFFHSVGFASLCLQFILVAQILTSDSSWIHGVWTVDEERPDKESTHLSDKWR